MLRKSCKVPVREELVPLPAGLEEELPVQCLGK
jgi:hypothetical protein